MCNTLKTIYPYTALFAISSMILFLPSSTLAQKSINELESQASRFDNDVQALYRLDNEDLNRVWEAYCGEMDPDSAEDKEFAANIGSQLQNREKGIVEQLLGRDVPDLRNSAKKLTEGADRTKAQEILNRVEKEETNLNRLLDGVVLKGSNHPFVQYAIEYGKKQHRNMCDEYGGDPKVCDKTFPGVNGRPDLVTVEGGHLVIYEFKPDNSDAKNKGQKQVEGYLPGVVAYYQAFFEDGRNAGFKGNGPDSDHGGMNFLKQLKASKDTWSSDGSSLQAIPEVKTYNMCEKRFGN